MPYGWDKIVEARQASIEKSVAISLIPEKPSTITSVTPNQQLTAVAGLQNKVHRAPLNHDYEYLSQDDIYLRQDRDNSKKLSSDDISLQLASTPATLFGDVEEFFNWIDLTNPPLPPRVYSSSHLRAIQEEVDQEDLEISQFIPPSSPPSRLERSITTQPNQEAEISSPRSARVQRRREQHGLTFPLAEFDPDIVPSHLNNLLAHQNLADIPQNPYIFYNRKLISQLLGGTNQASYTRIHHSTSTDIAKRHGVREIFCWSEGGEPLFSRGPGMHGAALTFAIKTSRGQVVHENGPASACREDIWREVETFRRLKAGLWIYLGTYRHGVPYAQLSPMELAALSQSDRTWWAENVGALTWAFQMFIDAGLANNESEVGEHFRPSRILRMMQRPDPATGAQIIFYWRYMECVRFNHALYKDLVVAATAQRHMYRLKPKLVGKRRFSTRIGRKAQNEKDEELEAKITHWEALCPIRPKIDDATRQRWVEIGEAHGLVILFVPSEQVGS